MGTIASDEWSEPALGIGVRGVSIGRIDKLRLDRTGSDRSISIPWNPAEDRMHFAAH